VTGPALTAQASWTSLGYAPERQRGGAVTTDISDSLASAMAAAQNGDADAYRLLLRRCAPVIVDVAGARGFGGAAVDDLVQETLLTDHRVRHTYDPGRPFLPWLRAIARWRAVDALRQDLRRRGSEAQDQDSCNTYPDQSETAEQGLDRQDRRRRLAGAMAELPEAQCEAVARLATGGQSLDQASAAIGRSKGALKVNLHRAIKALRAKLGRVAGIALISREFGQRFLAGPRFPGGESPGP
jgi:RNA polymerase sigma factor (sigma-70 family)